VILLLSATPIVVAQRPNSGSASGLKAGTFETRRFSSASVTRDVSYGIYLPKSYAEEGNTRWYPLVIWLHGMFEDGNRFNTRGGTATLDRLISESKIPELILVSPDGGRSSFFTNGKESGRWEDVVVKDLVAHLETQFRVAKDPQFRSIMGVSMGGMAALKIGIRFPALFGSMGAHSAALFPPDPENLSDRFKRTYVSMGERMGLDGLFGSPIDKTIWQANNPLYLAETYDLESLKKQAIYFDCGTSDRYEFDGPNEELHKVLAKRGVTHSWRLLQNVGHSWGSGGEMDERLETSLKFVGGVWAKAAKKAPAENPKDPSSGKGSGESPIKREE
jgi:S-formylglutathione hydrolase FrmB